MSFIRLNQVDLEYPVRENQTRSLKELVLEGVFRRRSTSNKIRIVRALQKVTFSIGDGERVGIIGFNGAGKSTLLRTIAGIYPIARGSIDVDGSICSLFDISIGFEHDATGWENIKLRSYLQGETPQSLQSKIQEIADFSELGTFLDLPLRCYSTGMTMRLAFAVATSSHPDILLVDEVFSTGDLAFQKKAEGRMLDLMSRAKIAVMVGHDLKFLEEFCTRLIWMDKGQVHMDGATHHVIKAYYSQVSHEKQAA